MTATAPAIDTWPAPTLPTLIEHRVAGLRLVTVPRPATGIVEVRMCVPLLRDQPISPAEQTLLAKLIERTAARAVSRDAKHIGATVETRSAGSTVMISASALADGLSPLLQTIAASARHPDVLPADVRAVASTAAADAEIAARSDARLLDDAVRALLLGDRLSGARAATAADLLAVHPAAVEHTVEHALGPDGTTLVVIGPYDVDELVTEVRAAFGGWAGHAAQRIPIASRPPSATVITHRPGALQAMIGIAGLAPSRAATDYPDLAVAVRLVGGTASARMSARLRERRGYAYFANTLLQHESGYSRVITQTAVANHVAAAALNEMRYELGRAATAPFMDIEVAAGARGLAGRFAIDLHTAAGLADQLITMAAEEVPIDAGFRVAAAARAATAESVSAAAARWLAPADLTTVVVGDADVLEPALARLGRISVRR